MKILVCGDVHGNTVFLNNVFMIAQKAGIDTIMQDGDLGYDWPGKNRGKQERNIQKFCTRYGVKFYWDDGNHENHESIENKLAGKDRTKPLNLDEEYPDVFYCPRGSTWEWDGVRFMAFGGAYSVDKHNRTPYLSWWPNEQASVEDIDRALTAGKVDVIFSHDVPWAVNVPGTHAEWKMTFPQTYPNRHALDEIVQATRPELLIHGHLHWRYGIETEYHIDYPRSEGYCRVIGLAHESSDVLYILDTDDIGFR